MATHRIIVRSDTAKKLNLYTAAATVASIPLMDLPVLLSDKALQGSEKDLAKSAQSSLEAGMYPTLEFIPMPKLGYGNRPLASLGPETRVVLTSIVNALEDSLPKSSRQGGFSNFEKFGTESDDSWLVDFDIAACYEYIDHNILDDELIRQGADADIVRLTSELLHSMLARPIGLPQGLDPSHRLSDAYLDRIQRNLLRHGYSGTRFADDFRMVVQSPEEAHKLISLSIEEARSVHLTLAEQKIRVRRSKDVVAELVNRTSVFEDYVEKMIDELTEEITQKVDYDDFETEYVVPDEDVVNFAALEELLEDWGDKDRASSRALAHAGTFALRQAQEIKHDIKPLTLSRIIAKEPIRLKKVLDYLLSRKSETQVWKTMNLLSKLEFSTPWHILWLLTTASKFSDSSNIERRIFVAYARDQLFHSSETVRQESSWFLAKNEKLAPDELCDIYIKATGCAQIGLAAVAGYLSVSISEKKLTAIRDDSSLNRKAFAWGVSHAKNP